MKVSYQCNVLFFTVLHFSFCIPAQKNVCEEMFKKHVASLKNTEHEHPLFLITFSGVPGTGKSYCADHIEQRYDAVRLRTDDVRDLVYDTEGIDPKERENMLSNYLYYFFAQYKKPNKRIILDASIDRRYKELFPLLKAQKIDFTVIRMDVPLDVAIGRVERREPADAPYYLQNMNTWWRQYEKFGSEHKDSFIFDNRDGGSLRRLNEYLDKKLEK